MIDGEVVVVGGVAELVGGGGGGAVDCGGTVGDGDMGSYSRAGRGGLLSPSPPHPRSRGVFQLGIGPLLIFVFLFPFDSLVLLLFRVK